MDTQSMDTQSANTERFNDIAAEWDSDPQRVLMGQKIARAIRGALSPRGTEDALEFGAGTGLLTMILAPAVSSLTALDGSRGMLAVLRDKCARKHVANVQVIEGQVPDDLPERPFDLIYSSMTLHHVGDVPGLLGKLATHLRPGGRIALADLDAEDGGFHGDAAGVVHHGFDREVFRGWLVDAGFVDVAFSTAFTARRERDDGSTRDYPIFLAVATRRHA